MMQNIIGVISYLGLIRPENQIKNLILFIPIFFSGNLDFQLSTTFGIGVKGKDYIFSNDFWPKMTFASSVRARTQCRNIT